MVTANSDLQLVLDLVGVFAFALSGGLVAVRRRFDLVGVVVLAGVAGLGGGIIRDVFIGAVPPVGISDWRLVSVAVVAGLLTFAVHGRLSERARTEEEPRPGTGAATRTDPRRGPRVRSPRPRVRVRLISTLVRLLDAVGLAVFAVAGALKALSYDVGPLAAVVVGVITAVGGGMLRDVLAAQVPEVLRRELYAVPALGGAALVVWAHQTGNLTATVIWGSVILVFVTRVVAVALDLNAPTPLRTGDSR